VEFPTILVTAATFDVALMSLIYALAGKTNSAKASTQPQSKDLRSAMAICVCKIGRLEIVGSGGGHLISASFFP